MEEEDICSMSALQLDIIIDQEETIIIKIFAITVEPLTINHTTALKKSLMIPATSAKKKDIRAMNAQIKALRATKMSDVITAMSMDMLLMIVQDPKVKIVTYVANLVISLLIVQNNKY